MADIVTLYVDAGYVVEGYMADYATTKIHHMDLATKRIYLNPGVTEYHPVDDIYKEVRFIRSQDISLRVALLPVRAEGSIPKGGGKFTPRLAVFQHGWRIVPADETHSLYITGEQITDDGQSGPAVMNTAVLSPGTNVTIHYEPPAAELVGAEGGTAPTAAEVATAVRSELAAELLRVTELWQKEGLSPDLAVTVTKTKITAGDPLSPTIEILLSGDLRNTTTMERQ
jgi:hypothetical protein